MAWETIAAAVAPTILEGVFGKRQASKQMDFQAQQSATAYQRAVKDLKAAGLNPILAGTVGGASTPSGSMAPTPQFASNVGSALQMKRLRQEIKNLKAQENKTKEETEVIKYGVPARVGGSQVGDVIDKVFNKDKNINREKNIIQKRKQLLKDNKANWL
jgi:hypothetical protein